MSWLIAIGKAVLWVVKMAWTYPLIAAGVGAVTLLVARQLKGDDSWFTNIFGDTLETVGIIITATVTVNWLYTKLTSGWFAPDPTGGGGGLATDGIRQILYGPFAM